MAMNVKDYKILALDDGGYEVRPVSSLVEIKRKSPRIVDDDGFENLEIAKPTVQIMSTVQMTIPNLDSTTSDCDDVVSTDDPVAYEMGLSCERHIGVLTRDNSVGYEPNCAESGYSDSESSGSDQSYAKVFTDMVCKENTRYPVTMKKVDLDLLRHATCVYAKYDGLEVVIVVTPEKSIMRLPDEEVHFQGFEPACVVRAELCSGVVYPHAVTYAVAQEDYTHQEFFLRVFAQLAKHCSRIRNKRLYVVADILGKSPTELRALLDLEPEKTDGFVLTICGRNYKLKWANTVDLEVDNCQGLMVVRGFDLTAEDNQRMWEDLKSAGKSTVPYYIAEFVSCGFKVSYVRARLDRFRPNDRRYVENVRDGVYATISDLEHMDSAGRDFIINGKILLTVTAGEYDLIKAGAITAVGLAGYVTNLKHSALVSDGKRTVVFSGKVRSVSQPIMAYLTSKKRYNTATSSFLVASYEHFVSVAGEVKRFDIIETKRGVRQTEARLVPEPPRVEERVVDVPRARVRGRGGNRGRAGFSVRGRRSGRSPDEYHSAFRGRRERRRPGYERPQRSEPGPERI